MRPTCPFCHAGIDDGLAAHGGTCPSCFAEIPGEEAATNPGEEVLAQREAETRQRAEARKRRPLWIGVPVVLVLVGAAAWSLRPQPEVEALVFDEEFTVDAGTFAAWKGDEAPADPAGAHPAAKGGRRGQGGAAALKGPDDVPTPVGADGSADGGPAAHRPGGALPGEPGGVRDIGGPTAGGSAEADGSMDVTFDAKRKAAVLTSKDDIQKAVRDMLRSRVPRLQQCFDRSLKGNPDLAGKWRLAFTIGKDGRASDPSATGEQMHDEGFESCIVKEMGSWGIYAQLEKPWPVTLPVGFKSEG